MKYICTIVILLLMTTLQAQETTTIYLIRHAEKADGTRDTELSQAGKTRAQKWSTYFNDKGLAAIYATPYNRTNATAAPLAEMLKLNIILYNPSQLDLQVVAEAHKGKSVLIVGHSNTLPSHVNKLLNEEKYGEIDESEFGTLYTITINGKTIADKIEIL